MINPKRSTIYDIYEQDGYTVIDQEEVDVNLYVDKNKLPDSIYTAEGYEFDENEVVVYSTETTKVYLYKAMISNESDDLLYFIFDFSYDFPKSGSIISPYKHIDDQDGMQSNLYLKSKDLRDANTTYPEALNIRGYGPGTQFTFYVSKEACQAANGTLIIDIVCNQIVYAKEGHGYESQQASSVSTPDKITFEAEVLEFYDGYILVKPEPSWAINSADKIEVPMKNMDPALEPQVGDIIEISYSGEILETYPARLEEVYSIRVIAETTKLTLDDVIILSQYGYDLSWSDFENYDYIETGSGLYIRVYEINDLFQLMIGGGSPDSDPMYIYLISNDGTDDRIDIRDGGVTEFISEHNTANINFTGNRNLGLNAEIIEIDSSNRILYVKDIDKQDKVFGDRCAIDCSYAISRDNLLYVNYGDPNDVRTIGFDDFEVGDSIIIGMYDSEKEKAFNGSAIAEQIQLGTQKFIDENLIKKISKDLDLPADCSLSFIGEYSDSSDALLWFAIDGNYPDKYVAVECEKQGSGKYKFIDSYSPMTYALDIVHVVWKAEDIFLVNNRDCAQIVYMNEAREVIQEIDVAEHGFPYVFRLSMPTNPGICMFVDADGEEIR